MVHLDGTFTYTVPATMYDTGGTDTFTVTATNAGTYPHLHGISGFLNVITFGWLGDDGHDVSTAVTLTINAAPIPAIPAYTLGTVDHGTAPSPAACTSPTPTKTPSPTTSTVGPPTQRGTQRHHRDLHLHPDADRATRSIGRGRHPDQLADDFTVTVDDSHGGVITVPVTVSIDPANLAPAMTLVVSDPNSDGSVDVLVTVNDPDTDPVTYLVIHDPAYGTLTPTPGGYTYTPTDDARHAAAATPSVDTDSFQITASDRHHGIDTEVVTVTISPANIAPEGLTESVARPTRAPVSSPAPSPARTPTATR